MSQVLWGRIMSGDIQYSVYEAAEDTFLLAKQVLTQTANSALEMGVGSGLTTVALARIAEHVVGTDINLEAIRRTRERLRLEGPAAEVDLVCCSSAQPFSDSCFDLVVFNPPYLPSSSNEDIAVDGGIQGIEVSLEMLDQGSRTLRKGGKILLASSSHSNYGKLMTILSDKGFSSRIITRQRMFFEEIMIVEAVRGD